MSKKKKRSVYEQVERCMEESTLLIDMLNRSGDGMDDGQIEATRMLGVCYLRFLLAACSGSPMYDICRQAVENLMVALHREHGWSPQDMLSMPVGCLENGVGD